MLSDPANLADDIGLGARLDKKNIEISIMTKKEIELGAKKIGAIKFKFASVNIGPN